MTQTVAQKDGLCEVLIHRWKEQAHKLATLAEALPEDQYENKPLESVRSVGEVLRHVAFWHQYVSDTLRGRKANDADNELWRSGYATKAQVLEALKKTAGDASSALEELGTLSPQAMDLGLSFLEHTAEHYGQLVVYARLNGIVPPTTRSNS